MFPPGGVKFGDLIWGEVRACGVNNLHALTDGVLPSSNRLLEGTTHMLSVSSK
jgi:hypothetical protein